MERIEGEWADLYFSWRTKELGEKAFLKENPESTIIRPSIIFGPGDSFFNVRPAGSQSSISAI
jgi:dTDP-4-dehydrorhamnose reductase